MDSTLPCFACGRELDSATIFENTNQPSEAVTFTSRGQYGSTVFDPMDASELEINVCDPCLIERQDRVVHSKELYVPPTMEYSRPWSETRRVELEEWKDSAPDA